MDTTTTEEEHKSPVSTPSLQLQGLSLTTETPPILGSRPSTPPSPSSSSTPPSPSHIDLSPPRSASSSSFPSSSPRLPLEQWLASNIVETHQDDFVKVKVWTSADHVAEILYPKSRLSTMDADAMPNREVFRAAEALSPKDRHGFWSGEGGEHMKRIDNSDQHKYHLRLVMWHDFQHFDPFTQKECKTDLIKNTLHSLSKSENSTRVIRQLQAFAHFVCDGGELYIEPSKFMQCNTKVISQRRLFKKLVEKVLEKVKQSEDDHNKARERPSKAGTPSKRELDKTSAKKKSGPRCVVASIPVCEEVADEVLEEHPLISRVLSAEVKDGQPSYTIQIKDAESGAYSYDALAIRMENLSLLTSYNKEWKKKVIKIGGQIDPISNVKTFTVMWRGGSTAAEVSKEFFEKVDWMDYFKKIEPSSTDDDEVKSNPSTPARYAGPRPHHHSSSSPPSHSSSASSTPASSTERTAQQLHELVDSALSKAMNERQLRGLFDQMLKALKKESLIPAAETDKEPSSEMEEDDEDGDGSVDEDVEKGQAVDEDKDDGEEDDGEEREERSDDNDKEEQDEDERMADEENQENGDEDLAPRPRRGKRKATIPVNSRRGKRASKRYN